MAGELAAAIARSLRQDGVSLVAAGRTDAGVHAWGQVVTFDADVDRLEPLALQRSLNSRLAPAVVVRAADVVSAEFDARRSARSRLYRYTILNREVPDPFLAATAWQVPGPLSVPSLRLCCDPVIGEHDFTSFCRSPRRSPEGARMVRRVTDARWSELGEGLLRFEIESSSFCHQMVRSLVGTMVEVGQGRRVAGDLAGVLRARDRSRAGRIAPPHGLCLWSVAYDGFYSARPG